MDIIFSFFAMPVGITICFGPVLVAWWLAERKSADEPAAKDSPKK